jgi:hypothetical protein
MPVRRYDDFTAAEQDLWLDSSDPRLGEQIRRVWSFAERFTPRARGGVTRIEIGTASVEAGATPVHAPTPPTTSPLTRSSS